MRVVLLPQLSAVTWLSAAPAEDQIHTHSPYTHKHAFFVCLEHRHEDLLFVPIFLLASHLDLHPLKQDKQSQMKNLSWMVSEREIKHTEKNKSWVSLVSSINTLLLVCTYTSGQTCTILYCWVQSTVGR